MTLTWTSAAERKWWSLWRRNRP